MSDVSSALHSYIVLESSASLEAIQHDSLNARSDNVVFFFCARVGIQWSASDNVSQGILYVIKWEVLCRSVT